MGGAQHIDWIEGEPTREIIAAFYTVYNALGFGFLESVYANALAIELRARGFRVEREVGVEVSYLGVQAGLFHFGPGPKHHRFLRPDLKS